MPTKNGMIKKSGKLPTWRQYQNSLAQKIRLNTGKQLQNSMHIPRIAMDLSQEAMNGLAYG